MIHSHVKTLSFFCLAFFVLFRNFCFPFFAVFKLDLFLVLLAKIFGGFAVACSCSASTAILLVVLFVLFITDVFFTVDFTIIICS